MTECANAVKDCKSAKAVEYCNHSDYAPKIGGCYPKLHLAG